MKYYKTRKTPTAETVEVTKEEAEKSLRGYWADECLDEIFSNDLGFRLWTPYAVIWTKTDDGLVPIPGFYGIVG